MKRRVGKGEQSYNNPLKVAGDWGWDGSDQNNEK